MRRGLAFRHPPGSRRANTGGAVADEQQMQQEAAAPWRPSARLEAMWQRDVIGPLDDFQDPSQEWRRLFSELLGTFFLVLVACGGGVMGQAFPNTISRTAAVTAPGLMVLAIILFMGRVSVTRRSASPSRCAATSPGGGCPATSSCS